MTELKTRANDASVEDFLHAVEDEQKRKDSFELLALFSAVTNEPPQMWGTSIIGFGSYHYKSDRSTQEGDWPLVGFSPRKQSLTLYIMPGFNEYEDLLEKIGPHKTSVGCLYLRSLKDVDMASLGQLIKRAYDDMKKQYPAS